MSDADRFVDLACLTYADEESRERRVAASALLAKNPALVNEHAHAAAAAGDLDALRVHLDRDPTWIERRATPRAWVPLLALTYSRVPQRDALGCLDLLLERGTDPNAFVPINVSHFSALAGAMGEGEEGPFEQPPHPDARAIAVHLLEAGASPNESQGLYDTHFLPGTAWLELLFEHGLTSDLDFQLGLATKLGFSDRVALLLAHGAPVDGLDHYNRRRHIENALLEGHQAIVQMLEAAGATPAELDESERVQAAILAGDRGLAAAHPALARSSGALIAAARHGRIEIVRLALDLGAAIDGVDHGGLTALHHAARQCHADVVRELLARGASRDIRDPMYGGTALGHAQHFSERWPGSAWPEVLSLLRP